MPLVSVIVPVYNRAATIEFTIHSILRSSLDDIEVIIIDDGSNDNTEVLCKNFSLIDSRISYVRQDNRGVSSARNVGLSLAKGKWISFVDSDDYVHRDLYGIIDKCKNQGPENSIDLYQFESCSGYYAEGIINSDYHAGNTKLVKGNHEVIHFFFEEYHPYEHPFYYVTNKLFLNKIIKDNSLRFRSDITLGEDQIFVCDYLKHVNCLCWNSSTYYTIVKWPKHLIDSTLSSKMRSPEELFLCQQENYKALVRLFVFSNNTLVKNYSANYILSRPITRIIYKYTRFTNRKYVSYSSMKEFFLSSIKPIMAIEYDNLACVRSGKVRFYIKLLFIMPFPIAYGVISLEQNFKHSRLINCYYKARHAIAAKLRAKI